MVGASASARRRIPRTDLLLADPRLAEAMRKLGRARVKALINSVQQRARRGEIRPEDVATEIVRSLPAGVSGLRPIINATGVLLHTNLGRAPLSAAAIDAVIAAAGYTDIEFDLTTGRRTQRGRSAMEALAAAVPEAAAVHVVNNGAAALILAATALAAGQEIIISRGELIEIGDGFRLTDILEATGARLREVGTTNRSTLADYQAAVGPDTAFVLKVHPSNYVVRGFTCSVPVADLANLGVPVVVDIGSGLLSPDPLLPAEPDAASALRHGAALVTASGDKLLGGPQAGLIFGRADLVQRMRRHPMARALRVDKLTLAALEATVSGPPTPTQWALRVAPEDLRIRGQALCEQLATAGINATLTKSVAVVGGGGAPGVELPSWALALPETYAAPLRRGVPAVVGRVERGQLLLDLRCVPPEADDSLRQAITRVATELGR